MKLITSALMVLAMTMTPITANPPTNNPTVAPTNESPTMEPKGKKYGGQKYGGYGGFKGYGRPPFGPGYGYGGYGGGGHGGYGRMKKRPRVPCCTDVVENGDFSLTNGTFSNSGWEALNLGLSSNPIFGGFSTWLVGTDLDDDNSAVFVPITAGSSFLTQHIFLPKCSKHFTITFDIQELNFGGNYASPDTLLFDDPVPNSQLRVDIVDPKCKITSLDCVIETIFISTEDIPPPGQTISVNFTTYKKHVVLRFVGVTNQPSLFALIAAIDDVAITPINKYCPSPAPSPIIAPAVGDARAAEGTVSWLDDKTIQDLVPGIEEILNQDTLDTLLTEAGSV